MKDLKVRGLNSRTLEFEEFALHSDFVVGALGLKHFLWIVGPAGCGKTTLACALAQYFTEGLDKSTFICTASYDALGMLTRNGKTMEQGSFVMDDAPFVSQNDIPLTDLNMISFCLPLQQCSIPARYHVAQCPAKVTRMGTHNAKMDPDTNEWDYGFHFTEFPGLAALARADADYFSNSPDDRQVALARRCLFLCIPDHTTLNVPVTSLEENLALEAAARATNTEAVRPDLDTPASFDNTPTGSVAASDCRIFGGSLSWGGSRAGLKC